MKQFFKKHTILVFYLLMVVLVGIAVAANWDVDSNDDQQVDGEAEAFGSGWDGDVNAPQKNDVYDYVGPSGTPTFAAVTVTGTVSGADGNFVVDGTTGEINPSATPGIEFTDSTHDAGGKISVNSNDANDAEMLLGVDDSTGDNTTYVDLDGVNERVDINYPLNAGMERETYATATVDLTAAAEDFCKKYYIANGAADVEFDLQASSLCTATVPREFYFQNFSGTYDMIIDPNSTDTIRVAGDAASCGAGVSITCQPAESSIVLMLGATAAAWQAIPLGGTDCACTP